MDGCNKQFIKSPEVCIRANVMNSLRWVQDGVRPEFSVSNSMIFMANSLKEARFDKSGDEWR